MTNDTGATSSAASGKPSGTEPPTRGPVLPASLHIVRVAAEIVVAITSAILFTVWSRTIEVDPLTRVGQVSGLAALQLRFAVLGATGVGVLVLVEKRRPAIFRLYALPLTCAAIAGMASGLVGGGLEIALHGTPWGLYVNHGDAAEVTRWSELWLQGKPFPETFPPLSGYAMAALQDWFDQPSGFALKDLQIFVTALYGPAAYLSWRLILRPVPALAIGVLTMMPFIEQYKPYTQIVVVIFIPVLVKFLQVVRHSSGMTIRAALLRGIAFGLGFAVLFLTYSGWFVWASPGAAVALAMLIPWRSEKKPALLFIAVTALTFVVFGWVHLQGLIGLASGTAPDNYQYFDTKTDPAYIAMWRDDAPGAAAIGAWPPFGEFAGVGVFTLLLALGIAVAIGLGWRRTVLIGISLPLVSAWLMRQLLASLMYQSGLVRLYPRTTVFILLGLLLLSGFAMFWTIQLVRARLDLSPQAKDHVDPGDEPGGPAAWRPAAWRPDRVPVGLLVVPLLFVIGSAGSSLADRYMPADPASHSAFDTSVFAWVAQETRMPDGHCAEHVSTCPYDSPG